MAFAPVAQLVEHLTFNQGVRSSILRRSTKGLTTSVPSLFSFPRGVAHLVERLVWDQEARSSSLRTSTILALEQDFQSLFLWLLRCKF